MFCICVPKPVEYNYGAFGIEDEYMEELLGILRQLPEIEPAVIYGSRARGDYHHTLDIDLLLRGKDLTNEMLSALHTKLYNFRIPYLFDLNIFENLTKSGIHKQC